MNFPAIICNNLQSCYCLLLCFFLFLAQIWRSVWFWDFLGHRMNWSDLIGRTNWDLGCFLILFRHEPEIGNNCPSKILVCMTPNSQLLELMIFLRTKSWLLVGPWVLYRSVAQFCAKTTCSAFPTLKPWKVAGGLLTQILPHGHVPTTGSTVDG